MKHYKPVEMAHSKTRLPQKRRKGQETPPFVPMSYEKPKKGTRS